MKYRGIIAEEFWNIEAFSKFIRRVIYKSEKGLVAVVEFTDDDLDEMRALYKSSATELLKSIKPDFAQATFVGSDNRIYLLNDDRIAKQSDKYFSFKKAVHLKRKYYKKCDAHARYTAKRIAEADKTQSFSLHSISFFKAYEFIDRENGVCFRYRVRTCKKQSAPLVVYFHGAGALGCDNIKQLAEFRMMGGGLSKRNATILLPQAPFGTNNWVPGYIDTYLLAVRKLIDAVAEKAVADKSRISVVGTSFGGCCTWQMVWDCPGYFSCAVPVMGSLAECWENFGGNSIDVSRLKNELLWVAHSADDDNVKIDCDDLCVKMLREIGANVKYTRWEKHGHRMSSRFYRRESWVDWMLSQSIDNR